MKSYTQYLPSCRGPIRVLLGVCVLVTVARTQDSPVLAPHAPEPVEHFGPVQAPDFDVDFEVQPFLAQNFPNLWDQLDMQEQFELAQEQFEEAHELQEQARQMQEEVGVQEEVGALKHFLELMGPSGPFIQGGTAQAARTAYEAAYKLILDEQWPQAREALQVFADGNPRSSYQDDARFWICYALEHSRSPDEEVFAAYHLFTQEHPRSRWTDDAKASLITVGRRLVSEGRANRAEYGPILEALQADADIEVALAALGVLQRTGDTDSYTAVLNFYNPEADESLRRKIVSAFGNVDHPDAVAKLVMIINEDPSEAVRGEAINALRRQSNAAAGTALKAIAASTGDVATRRSAVRALGRSSHDAVNLLLELAQSDPHIRIRTEAVSALARMDTPEAQAALMRVLERD